MVHDSGVLLVAAIGGYWVLERAATHKGYLKQIGQVLGTAIIVISLIGVACRIWSAASCPMGKGGYCPWSSKGMTVPAPSK